MTDILFAFHKFSLSAITKNAHIHSLSLQQQGLSDKYTPITFNSAPSTVKIVIAIWAIHFPGFYVIRSVSNLYLLLVSEINPSYGTHHDRDRNATLRLSRSQYIYNINNERFFSVRCFVLGFNFSLHLDVYFIYNLF